MSESLHDLQPGKYKCVEFAAGASAKTVDRLKSLGVIIGGTVEVVSKGNPFIIRVGQTKVGLPHSIARQIMVQS